MLRVLVLAMPRKTPCERGAGGEPSSGHQVQNRRRESGDGEKNPEHRAAKTGGGEKHRASEAWLY